MASINLKIFVSELENVLALYDTIQVQRTATAPPAETPVDLTALVAQPAQLTGALEGPYLINSRVFSFAVNGTQIDVTFTSPDPVALPDVIDEINAALTLAGLGALAQSDVGGNLQLVTVGAGTQFTLEIIGGSAAAILGFAVGEKANGQAAHIILESDKTDYDFSDGSGLVSYYYRSRFLNTSNGTYSAWTDWIQGTTSAAVDATLLIIGKVKLAGLDGTALYDKRIRIVNVFSPMVADGYGIFGKAVDLVTDSVGYAETALVKGSLVDVIFSGTSIIRRIQVPSVGDEFDLLDETLVVDDALEIQTLDIPYAPRRS